MVENFCSRTKREAIIAIGRTTNGAEFINSFSHELRHVADNIGKEKGLTDDESIAYMTGDISEQLSDVVCLLACDKCRTKYGLKIRNAINARKCNKPAQGYQKKEGCV